MIKTKTLILEILTEELPPKHLRSIAENLTENIKKEIIDFKIQYKKIKWFATPRRLAVEVQNLNIHTNSYEKKIRGPSIQNSFNEYDQPSQSAICWAKKNKIELNQSIKEKYKKGYSLFYYKKIKGENIELVLPYVVKNAIKHINFPQLMYWETPKIKFIRPIRNILLVLDSSIVPCKIFKLPANRLLKSNIYMPTKNIKLNHADQYLNTLFKKGNVIADYEVRKNKIITEVNLAAKKIGGIVNISNTLLEEVNSLVEWPIILTAKFDNKFLSIPNEALIYSMEKNQKYFPVYDINTGNLTSNFIFVSNIESDNPKIIINGNEQVIQARFSDAEFFFKNDRKTPLENYLLLLKKISFHQEIGNLYDKTMRLKTLIKWTAYKINANIKHSIRAAHLSKCDLITDMVREFPDIQGHIGMYYALYDNESKDVALAIKEQYLPTFSEGIIPSNPVSCALAITDKIDTLTGFFSIGQQPKNKKDPFALRRTTLGILKIIINNNIYLDLKPLIYKSIDLYNYQEEKNILYKNIFNFIQDRILHWYKKQHYLSNFINAIILKNITIPLEIHNQIQAISDCKIQNNIKTLISADKRISYVIKQSKEPINGTVNLSLINTPEEIALVQLLNNNNKIIKKLITTQQYKKSLQQLTILCDPINDLFKSVMIYDKNLDIRINRLILLKKIKTLFSYVAHFESFYS